MVQSVCLSSAGCELLLLLAAAAAAAAADEGDHCCDALCLTFTEQYLWPQATALATMNTSLLNTCSPAEYLGGPVAKLGCVKLPN